MRHAPLPDPAAACPVITPWDYVAMRRRAAGLSLDQMAAALRITPRLARVLETPGLRLQRHVNLSPAMPFSAAVYRQLADLPPHQHPRLCMQCGWDENSDQPGPNGHALAWSQETAGLCSLCAGQERQA